MNKSIKEQLENLEVKPLYILENEDRDALLESLKNPPEPNEALKEAFKFYKSKHDVFNDIGRETFERIAREETPLKPTESTQECLKDNDPCLDSHYEIYGLKT
jgi:hypothetical protein